MSELQGWIQVVLGGFGLAVAVVGVIVDVVGLRLKSPPEGGDSNNNED